MVFSSVTFAFMFFPVIYILYLILPGMKAKNILLMLASLLFYAWGEQVYVLLMISSVFVNYLLGLVIYKWFDNFKIRKLFVGISVIINIGMLFVFKYAGFFAGIFSEITNIAVPELSVHLPIGISFFTFQVLSYVIDVGRDKENIQTDFFNLLLYISFFPQLIAGPIVKYHDVMEQLTERKLNVAVIAKGVKRFIIGLSKKLIIADTMALAVDEIYALSPDKISGLCAWIGAVFYIMQIYFDFSGYSDMAIGLGKMFGFEFKENFNYPYISKSIGEFWRRWHISLSTWFKEYLYIPLGGNRNGKFRTCINLMIVFICTGLWHGANMTFVLWGIYNGIFSVLERIKKISINRVKSNLIRHIYTLVVVIIGFVIFRAESVSQAFLYIKSMFMPASFTFITGSELKYLTPYTIFIFTVACISCCPVAKIFRIDYYVSKMKIKTVVTVTGYISVMLLFFVCILIMASSTYSPFIYFRF